LHNHVIIGFCVEVVMSKCKLTRPLFYCIGYTKNNHLVNLHLYIITSTWDAIVTWLCRKS